MSDLLNSASLVMVPSGYKEDTVYSVVPSDGSGDLSFTRASNGTRVNSAGLVEVCPWNLASYSEDLSNAVWTKSNATISTNDISAPNGTTTADKITNDATVGNHFVRQSITSVIAPHTLSVYIKAGTKSLITIADGFTFNDLANFNLATQTATNTSGTNATIVSVGDGWYRCSVTMTPTTTTIGLMVFSGTTYAGTDTSGTFYIWGAQLNIGSTAKPYFPTTDRLNVPRLTYQNGGGGCPSLLLEKQSTNLFTYSEQFDDASWNKYNITIIQNNAISPDGTQNADLFYPTTSGAYRQISKGINVTSGVTYTVSVFVKLAGLTGKFFQIYDVNDNFGAYFNIDNGTIANTQNGSASIENFGNGWYRCSLTSTALTTNASQKGFIITNSSANNSDTITANGTNGMYIWGAQLEASSYPTSYIPTTSSSATRVADACYKTGISSLFGTNQGTFFIDLLYLNSATPDYLFDVTDSSNTNRFLMYDSNGSGLFWIYDSISSVIAAYQLTNGQRYKIAVKYNSTATYWYVNGVLVATGSNGFAYQMSQIYLGQRYSLTNQIQIQVNETIVFPTALSGMELISLTTI